MGMREKVFANPYFRKTTGGELQKKELERIKKIEF